MSLYTLYCRLYQGVFRAVSPLLPWREPERLEGPGSLSKLPEVLQQRGLSRVLIVTDRGISSLGLMDGLLEGLKERNIAFFIYGETVPNPTIGNIEAALAVYREQDCRAIIAFGGGSPMDCAKGVGARAARPRKSMRDMKGVLKVRRRIPTLAAVPTTAGTGSEATLAAVISNPETHEKYPVNDHALIPHIAVLDPLLTVNLPAHITATTGMDALTHAVEAYIGRSNTRETAAAAVEATTVIMRDLCDVYRDGSDVEKRGSLMKAAYLAGKAFTRAYVGYIHAMAHTLGGFYSVPHGLANSIILPHVLEYYGPSAEKRLAALARTSGAAGDGLNDRDAARAFIERIREMNREMNIPEFVEGIKDEDIPAMVERAFSEANPLYPVPRILSRSEISRLFRIISGEGAATESL